MREVLFAGGWRFRLCNGVVWESGNMPIYLATHVSVCVFLCNIILQESHFLLDTFGLLLHPGFIFKSNWVRLFSLKPFKVTRNCERHVFVSCGLNCYNWALCTYRHWRESFSGVKWSQAASLTLLTAPLDSQWGSVGPKPLEVVTPISPWFFQTQQHTSCCLSSPMQYARTLIRVDGCRWL